MLKYLIMLLMLIPLSFFYKLGWYLVQNMMFVLMFIMMLDCVMGVNYENMGMYYGWDLLSYGLSLLSVWICGMMILASFSILKLNYFKEMFLINVIMLLIFLFLSFTSVNLLMFYIYFESSLIPTFLLILGWGYQPERIQAGIYLLLYTLFASLPLLISLMIMDLKMNSLVLLKCTGLEVNNLYLYLGLITAFLVKMPMFLVHLWLPKAHVEAPVSGSMILAGVLLKLGGYGIIRVMKMMEVISLKYNVVLVGISMVGGLLVSMICLRQVDMKSLIAYSSVAHMSMVLGGMLTMNWWGLSSSYLMMISHGLCSSGLFCLSNMVYERLGSRSLMINKGLMNLMPSLALWWFLLSSSNMASPPVLSEKS